MENLTKAQEYELIQNSPSEWIAKRERELKIVISLCSKEKKGNGTKSMSEAAIEELDMLKNEEATYLIEQENRIKSQVENYENICTQIIGDN